MTLPTARISGTDIWIDDQKLPGLFTEGGVTFLPDRRGNRLVVEFLVGTFEADDPSEPDQVREPNPYTFTPGVVR